MSTLIFVIIWIINASFIFESQQLQYLIVHLVIDLSIVVDFERHFLLLSMKNSRIMNKDPHITLCLDYDFLYSFLSHTFFGFWSKTFAIGFWSISNWPEFWIFWIKVLRWPIRNKTSVSASYDVFFWFNDYIMIQFFRVCTIFISSTIKLTTFLTTDILRVTVRGK